jgi:K+ transporter
MSFGIYVRSSILLLSEQYTDIDMQNVARYDASVFKAFSPYFAGNFLVRNGHAGWLQLGGILLAFTGVETLFADLGAFSKRFYPLYHVVLPQADDE